MTIQNHRNRVAMMTLLIILSLYTLPCQPFTNSIITSTHKLTSYYSTTTTSLSKKYLFLLNASSAKRNKNHIKHEDDEDQHVGNDASLDFISLASDERLQKVIARAGIASRRAAEKMVS